MSKLPCNDLRSTKKIGDTMPTSCFFPSSPQGLHRAGENPTLAFTIILLRLLKNLRKQVYFAELQHHLELLTLLLPAYALRVVSPSMFFKLPSSNYFNSPL